VAFPLELSGNKKTPEGINLQDVIVRKLDTKAFANICEGFIA